MLAGFLALVICITKLFPDTALARSLHLYCVELPLEMARAIERKDIILIVIILCSGEAFLMLGSAELAMAYAVNMSVYVDAVLATYIAALVARSAAAWAVCKARVMQLVRRIARPRPRSRRTRSAIRPPKKPSNDDRPAWADLALAA